MQVRIKLMRNAGRWLTWNQKPREFSGKLSAGLHGKDERQVHTLFIVLPDDSSIKLFEPRITSVAGNELRIVGMEKVDSAWVLQEWECEILAV